MQQIVAYENEGEQLVSMDSDDYFAWQLRRSGRAVLASERGLQPHPNFAANARNASNYKAGRSPLRGWPR